MGRRAAIVCLAACGTFGSGDDVVEPPDAAAPPDAPPDAPPITFDDPPASVHVGSFGGCIVSRAGVVSCWGNAGSGAMGIADEKAEMCDGTNRCQPRPTPVPNLGPVLRLSMGYLHTCAIVESGAVYCWGYNGEGALGRGAAMPASSHQPTIVQGLPPALEIVAGRQATCARVAEDGGTQVYCWGFNEQGMLGPGVALRASRGPTRFDALANAKKIALSSVVPVGCAAINANDRVVCWGRNHLGTLGHPTSVGDEQCFFGPLPTDYVWCRRAPSAIGDPTFTVDDVTVGHFFGCARKLDGVVMCWGTNDYGGLGAGLAAASVEHPNPVAVVGMAGATSISARHAHACAVKDGKVHCWGMNAWGDLGDGLASGVCRDPYRCAISPVHVPLPTPIERVLVGPHMTVAHSADFVAFAWGANIDGRLGHAPGQSNDIATCGTSTLRCNPNPQPFPFR